MDPNEPSDPKDPDDDKGLSAGAVAGIVIGSVAVVGGGDFAAYWFVIRKRKFI